jgi:MFS family permease
MCLWSIVAGAQFWLNGRSTFLATRALLGLLQGGFIPDNVLYLSYFYKGPELPIRLAWFWVSDYLAGVVASFMAFGILHLDGAHGVAGWRWLFLIEGLLTLVIGVASFFMMPRT